MSAPNETTPLLPDSVRNDAPIRQEESDQHFRTDIVARSRLILNALRDGDVPVQIGSEPVNLITLLHAASHLGGFMKESSRKDLSISTKVARELLEGRIRQRLDEEVIGILNTWVQGELDNESLYEALWRHWKIDQRRLSAMHLILAADSPLQSRAMSHPVIAHFVGHLYKNGPMTFPSRAQGRSKAILSDLESAISPRRAHILHFGSYLALWVLTIILAMQPPAWATHTSPKNAHPSAIEILWMIFASAAIVQVIQHPRNIVKHLFLLPSALSLATVWTTYGFTFLALSIPCLTISLLRPEPPSIPFLFPSLLPQSIRLWGLVAAGLTGWALIWPMVLVLCVIFSISLNGDIFRGFLVIPTAILSAMDPPMEEGIAPYGTRLAIFGTIAILVCLAICLSISNMPAFNQSIGRSTRGDEERAVTRARVSLALGSKWLLGDMGQEHYYLDGDSTHPLEFTGARAPPVPLPFDLLLVALDVASLGLRLISRFRRGPDKGLFGHTVDRIRYIVAILVHGAPCWLLSFVI